jgi:hypothetical protein
MEQPLRRLATVQKFYAWGILALGVAPLAVLLPGRPTALADVVGTAVASGLDLLLVACTLSAIATGLSSRFVAQGSHPIFCRAVAVLNLLYVPFGTAMGVLTLLTLGRPAPGDPAPVAESPIVG